MPVFTVGMGKRKGLMIVGLTIEETKTVKACQILVRGLVEGGGNAGFWGANFTEY